MLQLQWSWMHFLRYFTEQFFSIWPKAFSVAKTTNKSELFIILQNDPYTTTTPRTRPPNLTQISIFLTAAHTSSQITKYPRSSNPQKWSPNPPLQKPNPHPSSFSLANAAQQIRLNSPYLSAVDLPSCCMQSVSVTFLRHPTKKVRENQTCTQSSKFCTK